jgi:hypothetical protein
VDGQGSVAGMLELRTPEGLVFSYKTRPHIKKAIAAKHIGPQPGWRMSGTNMKKIKKRKKKQRRPQRVASVFN